MQYNRVKPGSFTDAEHCATHAARAFQIQLDAGYPESNEDSRIKEMFEMSLEMSNVRNFQSSTAQGGGDFVD